MRSTMQDRPLLISQLFEYGRRVNWSSSVVTFTGEGYRRATFREVGNRAAQLANALRSLGVKEGTRVATFCMNHQEHLEAYLAVPSMGAVLHTLNVRLFSDQLDYIIRHAEDEVIIFDAALAPMLARVPDALKLTRHLIAVGEGDTSSLGEVIKYEELISNQATEYNWPEIDEREGAAMCYTSGTTGNPKGVLYSHRSTWLHTLAVTSAATLGIGYEDKALVIVPMFHANAWGTPYACWLSGADLVFPGRYLQAPYLARIFAEERPTLSAGVPTIWNDLLAYSNDNHVDLSSVRLLVGGGSAVPLSLIEAYWHRFGVKLLQGWGMTETSPLAALSRPPKGVSEEEALKWYAKAGRIVPGVELRVVAEDGTPLPWDGKSVGEIEARGPWVTGSYLHDPAPEKFHDGWLRTGDVGSIDEHGFIQISDRTKDVIKSGGEWISSVDLENTLMGHPAIHEAAVIGINDEKWGERPLACVVLKPGASVSPQELREWLTPKVARWWLPEYWAFLEEIPKTSVGKFDKKVLRGMVQEGAIKVEKVGQGER